MILVFIKKCVISVVKLTSVQKCMHCSSSGKNGPMRAGADEDEDEDDDEEHEDEDDDDDDGPTKTPSAPVRKASPRASSSPTTTPRAAAAAGAFKPGQVDATAAAIKELRDEVKGLTNMVSTRCLGLATVVNDGFHRVAALLATKSQSMETLKSKVALATGDDDLSNIFEEVLLPTLPHKCFARYQTMTMHHG